jgi:hypothetical protein
MGWSRALFRETSTRSGSLMTCMREFLAIPIRKSGINRLTRFLSFS